MIYFCCNENRRRLVRDLQTQDAPNGIDYLEVVDAELKGTGDEPFRQRRLRVFFVRKPAGPLLARLQSAPESVGVVITGGERVTGIVATGKAFKNDALEVTVNQRGDYSTYTLSLIEPDSGDPLKELDPQLATVDFSFKVECPSDFDCHTECSCAPTPQAQPEFDYLAKDYASFRQLLLDRMSLLLPGWTERNPADLGITLVELLAYTGDYLSYRQDAIGTEAYLGTARQRISVRRHTRLLDYAMHDGCNARVWVQVRLNADAPDTGVLLPRVAIWDDTQNKWLPVTDPIPQEGLEKKLRRMQFATRMTADAVIPDDQWQVLVNSNMPKVFEPMHDVALFREHNRMEFYSWGDAQCCLPKGATKAALKGHFPNLQPGDVLILKEEVGPKTGSEADADLTRRHAVRLTKIVLREDQVVPAADGRPEPYTLIEWAVGDVLPSPFCLSSVTDEGKLLDSVSVALGNIVLADHGMTISQPEYLDKVPSPNPVLALVSTTGCDCCDSQTPTFTPPRFQPRLRNSPITQAATITKVQEIQGSYTGLPPFDSAAPATTAFDWSMEHVKPAIQLGDSFGKRWL
ncbi:MAG TPA: hypothetical protein VKO66_01530, partial [Sideroxyarcus sp.]|nr:hypothetical protein [Sideroxyarcus sp.]